MLITAVLTDLKYDRIYNGWIIFGILSGLFFRIPGSGWYGAASMLAAMLLPYFLLYPVYRIGGLGAGDIKLLVMTGVFLSWKKMLYVIIGAFVIGSVFSILKLISEKNFKERMQYFCSYLSDVIRMRQWKLYEDNLKVNSTKYKRNKIHFALPVCISVMLELGGLF